MRFHILHLAVACFFTLVAYDCFASHPNIVLMMADDMGMGDTSAYQDFTGNRDHDQISTPNMERLARMGVRFTDAHTPSSRCSPTRYGLLTGRYPWRNRLKFWVLFGSQGDPMIERDRPTIASLLQDAGYATGMVGKWHVGLRYRQSDGRPADGWSDADLTKPLYDGPLDHGFDYCRFTSRSHGTSGPASDSVSKKQKKNAKAASRNNPKQQIGPGHIHGRTIMGATGEGKKLVEGDENEYRLHDLGRRHLAHGIEFMNDHLSGERSSKPFFLYYPSNSNHGPYTPSDVIDGVKVKAPNMAKEPMDVRSDYIYENDVVLGHLIDYLSETNDPRNEGKKLLENTIVIFTSDNGAEKDATTATGPFRSNKGSCYEGGHRVPFLVSWKAGMVGDGDPTTDGRTDDQLIGLQDLFATFADVLGKELPNIAQGEKGGEDSISVLPAWRGERIASRPMFFNDHKQASDSAVVAMRLDDPSVRRGTISGKWKVFFDAGLLRRGTAKPLELFNLTSDSEEKHNLLDGADRGLIEHITEVAIEHRNAGGHRYASKLPRKRAMIRFSRTVDLRAKEAGHLPSTLEVNEPDSAESTQMIVDLSDQGADVRATIRCVASNGEPLAFHFNERGLGAVGGKFGQVESGEAILVEFDNDVLVESAGVVAGNGVCGGFYQVGKRSPLAIYCVDADIDAKDQSGILSDIGVLKAGETLRLDSTPHFNVETPGRWRLESLTVREL